MIDGIGRKIDYLRISVTDKCNLRCQYCMPTEGVQRIPHEEVLTLEEIARVCKVMAKLGVTKVRLTGGEPLVRKNITKLIADIHDIPQMKEIAITTNGVLYPAMAKELAAAGLTNVNLSLDSLDASCFERITGFDELAKVKRSIEEALKLGMKLKINCVPCVEFNEKDLIAVAELAKNQPIDVRFIELMPIGCGKNFTGISSDEVLKRLEEQFGVASAETGRRGNGPANYVSFAGFLGKIGFISPISHKFCSECNRVRLTAEGLLKLCLHYNRGVLLRDMLRDPMVTDEMLEQSIVEEVQKKPISHNFGEEAEAQDSRKMYQIGG